MLETNFEILKLFILCWLIKFLKYFPSKNKKKKKFIHLDTKWYFNVSM